MSATGYSPIGPADMRARLIHWFSMDQWTLAEAIQLFACIDPERSRPARTKEPFAFEAVIEIGDLHTPTLDVQGYDLCGCHDDDCAYCEGTKTVLLAYRRKCEEIAKQFGDKYQYRGCASPHEWIERAISDRVEIPWLKWAKKYHLLPYDLREMVVAMQAAQGTLTRQESSPATKELETPAARRERLRKSVLAEKAQGTRAFLKVVAEQEGISVPRLKQLISTKRPGPANHISPWAGLSVKSR